MSTIISSKILKARKEYSCDGCKQIEYFFGSVDGLLLSLDTLSDEERWQLKSAKNDNCKILKGEKYIRMFIKDLDESFEFLCKLNIHEIIQKHEIYDE